MRKSRRLGIFAAAGSLLVAGGITAGLVATATANTAGLCSSPTGCTVTETILNPDTVTAQVSMESGSSQDAAVSWTASCTQGSQTTSTSGTNASAAPPFSFNLTLAFTDPSSCSVSATMTASGPGTGTVLLVLSYTPATAASPTPTPTATATATPAPSSGHIVEGYASKCVDDNGNSSALRNKIAIWSCNSSDKAQLWSFTNGELVHNGMCANDKATGGNGSDVVLYTCTGAANEIWTHLANGEFVLKARGGTLCLDDPAYSTHNGTQLVVWTCKDSANQRWYQP